MDEQAYWGIVLGGLGALIGVIGGAVGTYFSIKNTSGPKERDYMVKSAVFFLGIFDNSFWNSVFCVFRFSKI